MDNPHAISVYTDGSVFNNPGLSGKGFVVHYPDGEFKEISNNGYKTSTINRMELWVCVDVLRFLQKDIKAIQFNYVCIYSDSAYVVDNYKNAIYGTWQNRDWKTLDNNDIDNQDLWKDLTREFKKIKKRVEIIKVKAHSGNIFNDKADKLAKKSRKNPINNDFKSERTQIRRWLKIPENKFKFNYQRTITVFVQRTDPRETQFDAFVQVLKPKKYFGCRIKIRGNLEKHHLRGAHVYEIKLDLITDGYFLIRDKIKDLGKSQENKGLIK